MVLVLFGRVGLKALGFFRRYRIVTTGYVVGKKLHYFYWQHVYFSMFLNYIIYILFAIFLLTVVNFTVAKLYTENIRDMPKLRFLFFD